MTWNSPHFRACVRLLVCLPLTATVACDEESSQLDGELAVDADGFEDEFTAPTAMQLDIPHDHRPGPSALSAYDGLLVPDQPQISLLGNGSEPIVLEACLISGTTIICNESDGEDDVPLRLELIVLEAEKDGCMAGIALVLGEGFHELEICNYAMPRTAGETRGQGPVIDNYQPSTEAEGRRKQMLDDEASDESSMK